MRLPNGSDRCLVMNVRVRSPLLDCLSRKRLRPRLRERIRQRFWKRSRQGQRQRQRKRKGPQITLARDTSPPTAMASHHCAWQRLRHKVHPLALATRVHPNSRLLHTRHWQLHHLGAWLPFYNSWIRYLGNTSDGFTI